MALSNGDRISSQRLSDFAIKLWAKLKDKFAPKSHKHNATDIDTGTLPIERGGTGGSSATESVTNMIQGVRVLKNESGVDANDIIVASWDTKDAKKTSGWYTIGTLKDWLKSNLGLTASDVGAASSSHSHSDYVSKSTTSGQTIKSNLNGPRFEVSDNNGNCGAFLVGSDGNVLIKGHKEDVVLTIKKKNGDSGVDSITASCNWVFSNEINASISGRASYLKDVHPDSSRTYNCYLKWNSPDIDKVSPSGGDTRDHSKYLAAWELTSKKGNPSVSAVDASNVTVGCADCADTVDGWHLDATGVLTSKQNTIFFV